MAADDTDTQTAAPPPSAPASPDVLAQALQLSQQLMPQPVQQDTTPAQGGIVGLLGRIGSALAGGSVTDVMSPAQKERAGLRALGDFGTSLMAGSGYYPGKPMFGGLAQGFQGAEASERGSEQQVAAQLGAQQDYQTKQAALRLKALQDALPLLTLDQQSRQAAAARALAGGGTAPGTAAGAGQPGATYESAIGGIEGTGKNPRSSSSGVGGFLDSTWQDFASANPDLFKGMTPAQVMAAKSDPGLGAKAITWLAQRNAGVLGSSNIAPTGQSLGIAHYVGPGPAAKIMAAPDNAPVSGFVSPQAVQANPELASMTAGQMKQRYAGVPTPGFLKPAGGPAASAAPLPAPVKVAGPGAPTGGSTPAAPDTTPWDLPGSPAAPATPTPPTDTTTPPPPAQPVAPTHPDIPVPGGGVISHPGEFADYRAKQFVPPTGEDFNPNLAPEQQQAFATKAQQLQLAQQQVSTLPFAEQPKALIEVKAKQAELAAAQQDAIAAKRQAAATNVTKYNETQQKDIQTRYDAATAAYNTAAQGNLTNQNQLKIEQAKAGYTLQQKQADTDMEEGKTFLADADQKASQASDMRNLLSLIGPNMQSLPTGMVAQVLSDHPGLVTYLKGLGVLSGPQADATQLISGLTQYASTMMRPKGTGALRTPEMTAFQKALPNLLESDTGRQKALSFLLAYNDRIVDEANFAHSYFKRQVPNTGPNAAPGSVAPAYNIDNLWQQAQKPAAQGGLGDVIPHYHGNMNDGAAYQQWEQSQTPSRPYWGYAKDKKGNLVETLKVAPQG